METAPPINELVETIRGIIGMNDAAMSREDIVALLQEAEMDPNKAVDLFFQAQVNGKIASRAAPSIPPIPLVVTSNVSPAQSTPPVAATPVSVEWSHPAAELGELLGGEVNKETIMDLLQRSDGDLERAVELYFARIEPTGEEEEEEDVLFPTAVHSTSNELEIQPMFQHPLEPLAPHSDTIATCTKDSTATPPSTAELESLLAPGTYEVIMKDPQFRWQVGKVFNRAVVQWVDPNGPAALAGIQKSDVLLSFRDVIINECNCSQIINELAQENVVVPSSMRLRRAPDSSPPSSSSQSRRSTTDVIPSEAKEDDGDVVMTDQSDSTRLVEPKYGLQVLYHAVAAMMEAMGDTCVEMKALVDLLLLSEFNLDVAVNHLLNQHRTVCDFRQIVGYNFDPKQPFQCMQTEPYVATIPVGPLGLTVENVLERTIIVDIKPGGAAERANIKRTSWLVALNGTFITHLTHKETLQIIESASRPVQLLMVHVPPEDYRRLRSQLQINSRQPKTERPIPEQDRMSFRVFQLKIHQAVLVMPKLIVVALFQHLTTESCTPLNENSSTTYLLEDVLPLTREEIDLALIQEAEAMKEEQAGEMSEERRFLLNLFAAIHDHEDKGESIVIRTIQFLGWLTISYAVLQQHVQSTSPTKDVKSSRYVLLLSVVTHVLESLSIIENHATWDVMVDAFRLLLRAMTDHDIDMMIAPMMARLSISPSPTARIVPIALLSLVYLRVSVDVRIQLRGMLDRMCNDDNPLVRRAIASIIGELVSAAGASAAQWGVHLLTKATADTHDIVRIFAVKSCIRLAKDLRELLPATSSTLRRLLYCQMVPMVNTFTSDPTWQVRLEAAKTLPAFCLAFGSEYADVFVDHFVGMVRDPTVEIRRTCAENAFDMGDALLQLAARRRTLSNASATETPVDGPAEERDSASSTPVEAVATVLESIAIQSEGTTDTTEEEPDEFIVAARLKIVRSVLPPTYHLATDLSVAVRLALAKSVGKCVQLVGPNSYNEMVPIFTQLLDETQEANVRASLLEEMARYCEHTSETISAMLVPAVTALRTSSQWRVRVKFVHCVAACAARCDQSGVPTDFADATLEMLTDTIYEVRTTACNTLPILGRSMGHDWLVSHALPRISKCLQGTFHERITGLVAIEALAPQLKEMKKLQEVIETVVKECSSTTPNVRFCALRLLASIVLLLDDPTTTVSIIESVRPFADVTNEKDMDVHNAAMDTLERLQAHQLDQK